MEKDMSIIGLLRSCSNNDYESVKLILKVRGDHGLNANVYYAMPPGFILALPQVEAAEYNAKECADILLQHGANPDMICCSTKKTARQLKPEWFENVPKQEERIAEKFD